MTLGEQITRHVAAGFSGLWVETKEREQASVEIKQVCKKQGWNLAEWDVVNGMASGGASVSGGDATSALNSLAAISSEAVADKTGNEFPVLLLAHNLHL